MNSNGIIWLSVVLCTYNDEKFIQNAVLSILEQTYPYFEFIIIDDGSTDNTNKILKSFSDDRIKLIEKENTGLIDSLNLGFSLCKYDWIARMDGDDIAHANRLEVQIKAIANEVSVVGTQCRFINEKGNYRGVSSIPLSSDQILKRAKWGKTMLIHPTTLINKRLFYLANGYDYNIKVAEDLDLWLKLSKLGKIINITNPCLDYRIHGNNISIQKREISLLNSNIALYRYKNNYDSNYSIEEYNTIKKKINRNWIFKSLLLVSKYSINKKGVTLRLSNALSQLLQRALYSTY